MFGAWRIWGEGLRAVARRFAGSRNGAVAMYFALAAVPLFGLAGAALDYSRVISTRTRLQAALDATALALSKKAALETAAQLQSDATTLFKSEFQSTDAKNASITATYSTTGGFSVTVKGSAQVTGYFSPIVGVQTFNVSSTSTVTWGGARLRVALVLDTTGSMADNGKIDALKTATTNLLSQLKSSATTAADVYVSIIPFTRDVNIGSSNYSQSYIDWTDWNANNGTCAGGGSTQSSCSGTWTPASQSTWNGCVTDRGTDAGPSSGAYDTNVLTPSISTSGTLFTAEQYAYCPAQMIPLTNNWNALNAEVQTLSPNGNTNQTIGFVHGWMSLVGGGPYPAPPAMASGYTYYQVVIILSDGLNTEDRWSSSQSYVDGRENLACTNAKATGVIVYSIQVNTSGDPVAAALQNCATSSSYFYEVTSSGAINAIFQQIGTQLSKLRVSS
jgi:Flp pilus assembly protein TadG